MAIRPKCKIHGVPLVCFCPACRGAVTSKRKAEAVRHNGKLGGRPRKPLSQLSESGKYQRARRERLRKGNFQARGK